MTEVVRSTERVKSAAEEFQMTDDRYTSHHESTGPPLKSFIFNVQSSEQRYETYAEQTLTAVPRVRRVQRAHSRLRVGVVRAVPGL